MNLHSLHNAKGARTRRKRVGRGHRSGHGKTSCRGSKGQMARSGHKHKAGFEGGQMPLVRRLPKRGFHNRNGRTLLAVNVGDLAKFDAGGEITIDTLRAAGLANGAFDGIKILGTGDLDRKLTVRAHAFSQSARAKIEAAGGVCELVK